MRYFVLAFLFLLTAVGCAGVQDPEPYVFDHVDGRVIQYGEESTHVDVSVRGKIYVWATIETSTDICYGDDETTAHIVQKFKDLEIFGFQLDAIEIPLMVDAACAARGAKARAAADGKD